MALSDPSDNHDRLALHYENVSGLVRQRLTSNEHGHLSAVSRGSAAVATECDRLEIATGRHRFGDLLIGAEIITAENRERSDRQK